MMNRCLRCSGPNSGTSAFCDNCQSSLLGRSQQKEKHPQPDPIVMPPTRLLAAGQFATPGLMEASYNSSFSAREASPSRAASEGQHGVEATYGVAQQGQMLLADRVSAGEFASDPARSIAWQQTILTDRSAEAQELKDAKVTPSHIPAIPLSPPIFSSLTKMKHMRKAFVVLLILAILGIALDGALVLWAMAHPHNKGQGAASVPMLLLSSNVVNLGDNLTIHLTHARPSAQIYLTRDVHEPIRIDTTPSLIRADANGEATLQIPIDGSWKPGSHQITAEDVDTHYTTSVVVYVIGPDSIRPAQLQISPASLAMGAEVQWKNTIRTVVMSNTGNGAISWVARSNQPWLMLTPGQGTVSGEQSVSVSVTRAHLLLGDYKGTISIFSNTDTLASIQVTMTVLPLPKQPAAVLGVTPAAFSFSANDGGADPSDQVLHISNPGSQSLSWSLNSNVATDSLSQGMPSLSNVNWLEIEPSAGMVAAGGSATVRVHVHNSGLLQGVYTRLLTFTADKGTLASPQPVVVSVNVVPSCGVVTSSNSLFFNAVTGQGGSMTQNLGLSVAVGCPGSFSWRAYSLSKWLTLKPNSGQLQAQHQAQTTLEVTSSGLSSGTYNGLIVFTTEQRTDMILVKLTVQPPGSPTSTPSDTTGAGGTAPPSGEVNLNVSPQKLTFTAVQGQPNPPAQTVTLADSGSDGFSWYTTMDAPTASWLKITPQSATTPAGQAGQIMVSSSSAGLGPGTYATHIRVTPTDVSSGQVGSSRTITVTLNVLAPCTLQVAPTTLSFSNFLFQPNPPAQSITLKAAGGCTYPITWTASVDAASRNWLSVTPTSSSDGGAGTTFTVNVSTKGMILGSYKGQITISGQDSNGVAMQNGAQVVSVTLTVIG